MFYLYRKHWGNIPIWLQQCFSNGWFNHQRYSSKKSSVYQLSSRSIATNLFEPLWPIDGFYVSQTLKGFIAVFIPKQKPLVQAVFFWQPLAGKAARWATLGEDFPIAAPSHCLGAGLHGHGRSCDFSTGWWTGGTIWGQPGAQILWGGELEGLGRPAPRHGLKVTDLRKHMKEKKGGWEMNVFLLGWTIFRGQLSVLGNRCLIICWVLQSRMPKMKDYFRISRRRFRVSGFRKTNYYGDS